VGTTPSISFPTTPALDHLASYYVVSGTPAKFHADYPNLDNRFVIGPFVGALVNKTTKDVFVGMSTKEHAGDYYLEKFNFKFNDTDWRKARNGGVQKLSLTSLTNEPKNWVGIGETLPCDLASKFPQSDCPNVDDCTAQQCANKSGKGVCEYNALVCNHPNWDRCYPDEICPKPYPARYNAGCALSSKVFGHTTGDVVAFGFYGPYPEKLWYDVGCVRQAVDCEVSKWGDWSYCFSCDKKNRTRTRKIKLPPSKNPDGRACPVLTDSEPCSLGTRCGRLVWNFVNFEKHWVEIFNPSDKELDISGWILRQKCIQKMGGITLPKDSVLKPGKYLKIDIKQILNSGTQDKDLNVLCLYEINNDGEFTGSHLEFDQIGYQLSID